MWSPEGFLGSISSADGACRATQAAGIVSIQGSLQDASTGSLAFLEPQLGAQIRTQPKVSAAAAPTSSAEPAAARVPAGTEPAPTELSKQDRKALRKAQRRAAAAAGAQQLSPAPAATPPAPTENGDSSAPHQVAVAQEQQPALASASTDGVQGPQAGPRHEAMHRKHKRRKLAQQDAVPNGPATQPATVVQQSPSVDQHQAAVSNNEQLQPEKTRKHKGKRKNKGKAASGQNAVA